MCGMVNSIEFALQFRLSAASKTSLLLRFRDWSSNTFTLKLFCSKLVKGEKAVIFFERDVSAKQIGIAHSNSDTGLSRKFRLLRMWLILT